MSRLTIGIQRHNLLLVFVEKDRRQDVNTSTNTQTRRKFLYAGSG